MADIPQLSPDEIESILNRRLISTNDLYCRRNPDNLDQEKVIFFKYYFDFSSAIESCLRGIIFEYCKNTIVGPSVYIFAQPQSYQKAYFLNEDEFESIVNKEKIFENRSESDFNNFSKMLLPSMCSKELLFDFTDFVRTKNIYKNVRKIRNTIAHGLKALENMIEYSPSQLFNFVFIYYLLVNYYKDLYKLLELKN